MGSDLPGGYAGNILRVDLGSGRIWTQAWTPEEMRLYVGGAGLGVKILWDEVPADVGWDHPENRLFWPRARWPACPCGARAACRS